jgi:putative methionine-R-sulfoxide reductase with GAF domain
VFLYDNKKGELWSRGAIGTHTIKIPVGRGIAGHVASTGEYLNILDAHKDKRFNSEHDKKTNYRTKSILCMPIMDLE